MPEHRDAMIAFKLTGRARLEVDHAVRLEGITLSELARTSILNRPGSTGDRFA